MPGRWIKEAIYLLQRLMERYQSKERDLLENVYDWVPREVLWKTLEKKTVRVAYIHPFMLFKSQDMYDMGETKYFPIRIGLHQGSILSPSLI